MIEKVVIRREFAQPNKQTFTILPIRQLLARHVKDGKRWVDPFSGESTLAEFTNDLNPKSPAKCHLFADDFCKMLSSEFNGVLFDPPYSYRQIKECYESLSLKTMQEDTQSRYYNKVMNAIADKIKIGGLAISFGWNSNGFGANRGFQIIEILMVAHGNHHNDTIVTVERKYKMQALLVEIDAKEV